jgi:hypothetical protein
MDRNSEREQWTFPALNCSKSMKGSAMARKHSTSKRVDQLLSAMKTGLVRTKLDGKKPAAAEDVLMLMIAFAAPVNTAFEKAGLNFEDISDWMRLTIYLACAVYGKSAGRPTTWSSGEYERLLADFSEVKAKHPNYGEERCCASLLKTKQYRGVNKTSTLRRQLQNAKQWKMIQQRLRALAKSEKGLIDVLKAGRKLRKRQSGNAQPTW